MHMDAVKCAILSSSSTNGWTSVILEEPFGRDSKSSAALIKFLKYYLGEDHIFRNDHFRGKELAEKIISTSVFQLNPYGPDGIRRLS